MTAEDGAPRTAAKKSIENMGLPVLPHLLAKLKELNPNDPAREALEAFASRIASIVTLALAEDSAKPDQALQAKLDALKGAPLTADAWVDLLLQVTCHMPDGAHGIQISADREGGGDGLVLTIKLLKEKKRTVGTQKGWDHSENVKVGKESIHNSSGFGSWEYLRERNSFDQQYNALKKALAAPATEALMLRSAIVEEQ